MANPEKGEVDLTVGGKVYTLRLTTNAACEVQAKTGKGYGQLMRGISAASFDDLRSLLWVLLKPHHAKEFQTLELVGEWIDLAGGFPGLDDPLTQLVELNQPKARPPGDGDPARPQPAPATASGAISSSKPGASA